MNIETAAHIGQSGLTGIWVRIDDRQYVIGFMDGVELVVDRVTEPKAQLVRYAFDSQNDQR